MIKSNLTNAYLMFVMELADPSTCDRVKLEEEIKGKISELFDTQPNGDRAKRNLKDRFNKVLAIYFNSFIGSDGLNYARLDREMSKNRKHLLRHVGKHRLAYLTLITQLMSVADGKQKKGLLFAVGS